MNETEQWASLVPSPDSANEWRSMAYSMLNKDLYFTNPLAGGWCYWNPVYLMNFIETLKMGGLN